MYADGGSRGNPGPAGYGAVVLTPEGDVLAERAASLGRATNNVAEYNGLLAGLRAATALGADTVAVRMDSKLVVEQMSGRWQVKHPDMKPLAARARELVGGLRSVTFEWVPRARNSHADRLANEAMDAAAQGRDWAETVDAPAPWATEPVAESEPLDLFSAAAETGEPTEPVTTTLLLVRHGETTASAQGRYAGRQDPPLTTYGTAQAVALADRLAALRPDVVVSSPLQRCRDTAARIAPGRVRVEDDLTDAELGDWSGLTRAEIAGRAPGALARWAADAEGRPPGGESFADVRRRVVPVLERVLAAHPGRTVVVVTHSAVVKMALAAALDVPSAVGFRFQVDPASLSVVTVGESVGSRSGDQRIRDAVVHSVNDVSHLSGRRE
jgi:ribonuclease H / adenosylcobalamin/alpha-ribazole phosphatase